MKTDQEKAKALLKMAEITLQRLSETDYNKYPSNTLTDYYDIIHKLLEALSYIDGTKIKGEGAHQKLIDYISKQYNLEDQTRIFLQDMRDYRNRISYEGFSIPENYIVANSDFIEQIIDRLVDKLKEKLA